MGDGLSPSKRNRAERVAFWKFVVSVALALLAFSLLAIAASLIYHGYNQFNANVAVNTQKKTDALESWRDSCEKKRFNTMADALREFCNTAFTRKEMDVFAESLQAAAFHVLQDMSPARFLGCDESSHCHYVLLKGVETIFANTFIALCALSLLALASLYFMYRLPSKQLHEYRRYTSSADLAHRMRYAVSAHGPYVDDVNEEDDYESYAAVGQDNVDTVKAQVQGVFSKITTGVKRLIKPQVSMTSGLPADSTTATADDATPVKPSPTPFALQQRLASSYYNSVPRRRVGVNEPVYTFQ